MTRSAALARKTHLPPGNAPEAQPSRLPPYRICGDPAKPWILVLGGISANRKIYLPPWERGKGWWQNQAGPETALDTSRFCLLGMDYLGPRTGSSKHGESICTTTDQAQAIAQRLEWLSVKTLHSCIGASYGGMVVQALARDFPAKINRCLVIGAAHEPWPMARAIRQVQRRIVRLGQEWGHPQQSLALARSLAMTTYRSATEFAMRFSADESGANHCKEYLLHCGERFARDFRGEEFLSLSQSIDQHCIKPESIQVSVDILGFNSDQIAPPEQLRTFHGRLAQPGNFNIIHSLYGHDAFLKESAAIDKHIRQHLEAIDENS